MTGIANAGAAGDNAHAAGRGKAFHRVSGLIEIRLPAGIDRHIDDATHAEAEQDALLHPRVDAPAGGRVRVRLGGARAAFVQRGFEFGEEAEVIVAVRGGLFVVESFDFSLQPARSRADPSSPKPFRS